MSKRRYDDKFRASAVVMLEAAGYPDKVGALARVSKATGAPPSTLSGWFKRSSNPPPSDIRDEKELDLVQALKDELTAIFPAMAGVREDASYRELAISAAIMIDKLQLLKGGPTDRTEHIHTDDISDQILADIARESSQYVTSKSNGVYHGPQR